MRIGFEMARQNFENATLFLKRRWSNTKTFFIPFCPLFGTIVGKAAKQRLVGRFFLKPEH
jgi:hypothetical protein